MTVNEFKMETAARWGKLGGLQRTYFMVDGLYEEGAAILRACESDQNHAPFDVWFKSKKDALAKGESR